MQYQEKTIDSRKFRDVMGKFATGVTVVTVQEAGNPHGMTVNSFTSVSLDPLLVLISLDKESTTTGILRRTGRFTVNILAADQEHIARRFAESGNEGDRFRTIEYTISEDETPVLKEILGYITCTVKEIVDGGDHSVFIGEVIDIGDSGTSKGPLLFFGGNYKSLAGEGKNRQKG